MARSSANTDKAQDASLLIDDHLCFALYSATHSIQRLYRPMLAELGLTYPQYLVLLVLWEEDGLTVSMLGERLFLNSATLTPLLKRMEAASFVERRRSEADERKVCVYLTQAGVDLQHDVQRVTTTVTCAASDAAADPAGLLKSLHDLRDGLIEP